MEKATVILITLVCYKLLLIAVGLWAQRRTHDETDFFLGGRSLGPVVAAISYSASSSSAWTLLGMSGAAFFLGLSAIWLVVGAVTGMLIAWLFFAPAMMRLSHQHQLMTLTELLAFGSNGVWRKLIVYSASLIVMVAFAFYVAAQFQGAGNTFHSTFDLSMSHSIVLGASIILVYTLLGGFWAVSVTDTIQGVLMAAAALLLPIAAFIEVGGVEGFVDGLKAVSTPDQLSLTGRHAGLAAAGFVAGALGLAMGTFGQPHLLVRFMALRDARALRQARVITVLWFLIVFGGMCFVGLVGHVLLPNTANPETIFFALTNHLFSPLVAGVLVAAVLSAIMSTADSQLLVGASALAHDMGLNKRFPAHSMLISRLAIAVLVVMAVVISITLPATIFDRALLAWTALGAAFGPLVIFRLAGIQVHQQAAFAAIFVGFSIAVLFHFNPGDLVQTLIHRNAVPALFERIGSFFTGMLILWLGRKQV
ncbi:MAG: sodium/proline symporter [Oceanococcus sp.]